MTLVEVVVALSITGLAVLGIIGGYHYCTQSSQKAALSLAANARAIERLEETHSAKWDTSTSPTVDELMVTNFPTKVVTLDLSGSGTVATPATLHTQVGVISADPPLKRVRVDCVWQFHGETITNSVQTFRAPDQ
jgi:hypothetical protein